MGSHRHFFLSRRLLVSVALVWLALGAAACALLVRSTIEQAREAFETEARIAHRLLSQRAVQHEAMLITLRLLQPETVQPVAKRLAAVYPQLLDVRKVEAAQSEEGMFARLGKVDWVAGRFSIMVPPEAGASMAYVLELSLPLMVPWTEWPFGPSTESGSAEAALEINGNRWFIHQPQAGHSLMRFNFRKQLAATSQPFDLVATRIFRWEDLPWGKLTLFWILWSMLAAGALALWRQRGERRRAEALLRFGQISRLNALGELAAGMAHELNQPLTAVLAGTQASRRLLDETPPELEAAREAMQQVAGQARRAADVVARLRRCIDRPGVRELTRVDPAIVVREVMQLLAPECAQRGVVVSLPSPGLLAVADAVALEQIVHNLASNALHALVDTSAPALTWQIELLSGQRIRLRLRDNGPGLPPDVIKHLFEPFVSARPGGLGLGLSLCETLAAEMNGSLHHETPTDGPGAIFVLELQAATDKAPS